MHRFGQSRSPRPVGVHEDACTGCRAGWQRAAGDAGRVRLVERYAAETEQAVRELGSRLGLWVDIDRRAERSDGAIVLPLLRGRRTTRFGMTSETSSSEAAGCLIVHDAVGVELDDAAGIGIYEIDEVAYDPARRTFVLRSGVPMKLTILVRRLYVELELE